MTNYLDRDSREIFKTALKEQVLTIPQLEAVISEIKSTIEENRYDLMNKVVRDCTLAELEEAQKLKLESIYNGDKDSSFIDSLRYNSVKRDLFIEMKSGRYVYEGVPSEIARGFQSTDSLGVYYNENIKGRYVCSKI